MTDLVRLEAYYDAVPRTSARVENHGPLTLFVSTEPSWPYYARPRLGKTDPITAADVTAVRSRQEDLEVPPVFEWVDEVTPELRAAAEEAGLSVEGHPLLVLDTLMDEPTTRDLSTLAASPPLVRRVEADDPQLESVRAVQQVGFSAPGTAVGAAGVTERDAVAFDSVHLKFLRNRIATGETVTYAAFDATGPVSVGMHQPIGSVTEVVGVATLPAARRRGLGAAVTRALVRDALTAGAEMVFLSAADPDVARMYEGLGFRRVATAMIATWLGGAK